MNPVLRWFHQLGSPPYFYRFATRWMPWAGGAALILTIIGMYLGLARAPADYLQGDSFRIIYIHVPSAWMSMFIYAVMALNGAIALIWRIKLSEILFLACAPIGAMFTAITLITGMLWGKPTWGAYWVWDARLTSELVLLFLYFGVIGLASAYDDLRQAPAPPRCWPLWAWLTFRSSIFRSNGGTPCIRARPSAFSERAAWIPR